MVKKEILVLIVLFIINNFINKCDNYPVSGIIVWKNVGSQDITMI